MMSIFLTAVLLVVSLSIVSSFNAKFPLRSSQFSTALKSTVEAPTESVIKTVEGPDFYWKFRLDRLVSKKGRDLAFDPKNYPEALGFEELYSSYYLDLALQGKLENFDWKSDKEITDGEWFTVYKSVSQWTQEESKKSKADISNLPANDFDLLKQFYPQLNFRDLETKFVADEVGASFPYKSMKDLLSGAATGKLPAEIKTTGGSLEASKTRQALATLKEKTLAKVETIYANVLKHADLPFPDEQARKHYQNLRKTLEGLPQTSEEWAKQRSDFDKDLEEMAMFASRKEEPHHHDEGEDEVEHLSPAQEFQNKYGLNLDELQQAFSRFKANPSQFLEDSISEKFGKNGVDVWNKSQEFSAAYESLSAADRAAAEKAYLDFLKQA